MIQTDMRTVHLVDDDDAIRRSVGFMLKTSGFQVNCYETGDAFLKAAKGLEDGCILLDIRMPGTDGLKVQQALQEDGIQLPVIVMTGHGDITVAVKAMKAGAVDFIEKPFEKETLIRSLEEGFSRVSRKEATGDRRRDASVRLQALTPREREVLDGLAKGLPNKTIAYDLGISARTVEIHRANLMSKLAVHSLSEVLRIAFAASGE
jgi:two-component system, LuxR family, response regulator FixJ